MKFMMEGEMVGPGIAAIMAFGPEMTAAVWVNRDGSVTPITASEFYRTAPSPSDFMASWLAHQAEEAAKPAPLAAYPGAWPPPKQRFPGL